MEPGTERLAILADTHLRGGIAGLPEPCLELAAAADLVIHAGDLGPEEALDELEAHCRRLVAVHGNVDPPAVVSRLPATATASPAGLEIAVVHDAGPRHGRLSRLRRRFPGADAVVFGHSHLPLLVAEQGFRIFNPGSPTQRRRAPARTMGMATVEGGAIRFEHVTLS